MHMMQEKTIGALASDEDAGRRLWELSEELLARHPAKNTKA